jgi:predicted DCC family thiol-disulfide oxidoreductase YuxK
MISAVRRWMRADEIRNDDRGWTYNLALFRVFFLAGLLPLAIDNANWMARLLPTISPGLWDPVSFYRYLPLELLGNAGLAHALALVNVGLIVMGLLGIFTRASLAGATVLSLYLFGLPQNMGKLHHYHHLVWFLAILAAGPSGRALSIDALVRGVRSADRGQIEPPFPRGTALLTLRFAWLLIGLLYLGPGLAKLESAVTSGWASAENLRHIIWRKWMEGSLFGTVEATGWRADLLPDVVITLGGLGVIAFEIGFVALVLFRKARPWLATAGIVFHVGNHLVLSIGFEHLVVAYVSLIDWTSMGRSAREHVKILYDDGCRMCRRTISVVRALDVWRILEPIPGAGGDPRRLRYPQITDEMLTHDLFAIREHRVVGGYDAYVLIASRLPLLWPATLLMRLPPVAAIGRSIYRRVADSRSCRVAIPASRPTPPAHPRLRVITVVGVLLLTLQAVTSMWMLAYNLADMHLDPRHPVRDRLTAGAWRRPVWPFDLYPTFASIEGREQDVWEARVVSGSGRETRIPGGVYAAAVGNPSRSRSVAALIRIEPSEERHRDRSRDLVRVLWRYLPPELRDGAVSVRVYDVRYRIGVEPVVVSERLRHDLARPVL